MAFATLIDYRPGPRYDGQPWTAARLEEATSATGPWTEVETFALSPVDADPADPDPRNFESDLVSGSAKLLRLVYTDADSNEQATLPAPFPPTEQSWTPSAEEIATLIPARTVDSDTGETIGTFTAETHPKLKAVQAIAAQSAAFVASRLGGVVAPATAPAARHVSALRAAMTIELGYFPEQVRTDRSAYPELKALYDTDLASLPGFVQVGDGTGGTVVRNGFASVATHGLSYEPVTSYIDLTDDQLP